MREDSRLERKRKRFDALAGALISTLTLLIFLASPVHQVTDSNYSVLLSQSLLYHHSFMLDSYALPRLPPTARTRDDYVMNGDIWHLELVDDHIYYYFPPGNSVLSLPFVAVMNSFGISAANSDGTYNPAGEEKIETIFAAILMAALSAIFYYTSRLILPARWSVLVALAGALGTQVWSTASRALWSHTWEMLLAGIVVMLLLARETGRRKKMNPVWLASLLAWMYFVRPNSSVTIIIVTLYVFLYHRRIFTAFALTGAAWLAAFVFYSQYHFGKSLPSYYAANRLGFKLFPLALVGNLISPSRGLFVYVPALIFVLYTLVRYRKFLEFRRIVWLALAVVTAHLLTVSAFSNWWGDWWGGASYGPRYSSDLVPWFVLLAALGIRAMRTWRERQKRKLSVFEWHAPLALGAALLSLSVFINARGAISAETWKWTRPQTDEQMRALLWNWRYPQFMAGLLQPPLPLELPLIERETYIDFTSQGAGKFLWYGWSGAEAEFRWSDAREATVVFALNEINETELEMKFAPFLAPGKLNAQKVLINLNGQRLATLTLKEDAAQVYSVRLSRELLRKRNVLTFNLPDAASPESLEISKDSRTLGIRVEWMRLHPKVNERR